MSFIPGLLAGRIGRHQADYAALSATPGDFENFSEAVGLMRRTQPNYTAADLAATIPGAELVRLEGVSHFAPLQRPELFNGVVLEFLAEVATIN